MVSYKELGLVNTREMFAKAVDGGYAIPAFNFNNMEQMQAIIMAAVETKSPVILQVSKGARNYANQTLLRYMAEGAVEYAKELGCAHPEIVLHLDHGDSFELCKSCIDMGFSSVMIDGSALPYDENVALTKKLSNMHINSMSPSKANSAFWPALKKKFRLPKATTRSLKKSSISSPRQVATRWPSALAHHTAHTNSRPNNAPSTHRLAVWFRRHWHSMCLKPLKNSYLASRLSFTAHHQCRRKKSTPSTNTVVA